MPFSWMLLDILYYYNSVFISCSPVLPIIPALLSILDFSTRNIMRPLLSRSFSLCILNSFLHPSLVQLFSRVLCFSAFVITLLNWFFLFPFPLLYMVCVYLSGLCHVSGGAESVSGAEAPEGSFCQPQWWDGIVSECWWMWHTAWCGLWTMIEGPGVYIT